MKGDKMDNDAFAKSVMSTETVKKCLAKITTDDSAIQNAVDAFKSSRTTKTLSALFDLLGVPITPEKDSPEYFDRQIARLEAKKKKLPGHN